MMSINHDFLSGNFLGYPLEENTLLSHQNFNLKKYKINPLKNNIFNNNEDLLKELDELREYKKIINQKIKRYENIIYSYKNQIRNLKKNMLNGGEVNIQLINIFVNTICDIIEYLCTDINKPVLSTLPFIHTIINSAPLRDKKIYQCSKLIHITLTQINNENKINDKEKSIQEEEDQFYQFSPHKLQDLEWLASETNDKGWLTVGDRWELCKRDLKWLCVKTNNRSWLLHRHMWENSSNDLKYISVLFDDKKWLNLYKIWKFVPLSVKLRAISLKDPSICKPSLNEIMLKDDDIYKINMLELNSDISDLLKRNYLKYKLNDKMSDSLRDNSYEFENYIDKNENDLLTYRKIKQREDILEKSLEYNSCNTKEENILEGNENRLISNFLPREYIKNEKSSRNKLLNSKNVESEKVNTLKQEPLTKVLKKIPISVLKNENTKNNEIQKSKNILPKSFIKHEENNVNKKNSIIIKTTKGIIDNKSIINKEVMKGLQETKVKLELFKEGFSAKQIILKKIPQNITDKSLFNKENVEKNNEKVMEIKEFLKQNSNQKIQENKTTNNKEHKLNNDKKEKEIINNIKQKCVIPEKNILNNIKKENMTIKLPQSGSNLLEKKEIENKKEFIIPKTVIPTKIAAPLSILPKIKEENLKKNLIIPKLDSSKEKMLMLNKNNNFHAKDADVINEKSLENKNKNIISKTSIPKKIAAPLSILPKIKEENSKKFPIILKKNSSKENLLNINKNGSSETNQSSCILNENDSKNENVINITCDSQNTNPNDLKTIKRKESILRTHAFINNEKEIKINTPNKTEDPKKEPQSAVTNYFTDLFNAFNFVTKKEDDEIPDENEHNKVETEENRENENQKDLNEENLKNETKNSDEEENSVMDKKNLTKEGNKSEEKKDMMDEKKNSLKEEKFLEKEDGNSKLKRKHTKVKKKGSKEKEHDKNKKNIHSEEMDSRKKEEHSDKDAREKEHLNEKIKCSEEEKDSREKITDLEIKEKYIKDNEKECLNKMEKDLKEVENLKEEVKDLGKVEKELKQKKKKSKEKDSKERTTSEEKEDLNKKKKDSKKERNLEEVKEDLDEKKKDLKERATLEVKEDLNEKKKDLKERTTSEIKEDLDEKKKDLKERTTSEIKEDLDEKKKDSKKERNLEEVGDLVKKKNKKDEEKNLEEKDYLDKKKEDLKEKKKTNEKILKRESRDDSNELKIKLKSIKSLRNLNSNKYSIKSNLQGYSNKGKLLKNENFPNLEKKIENNKNISVGIEKEGNNKILDETYLESKISDQKNKSMFLEKPSVKFTKNKPSSILQKLLDSDLSDFDSSSKKMTAEEIAKHTNASLQISVKRKASLSSIKVKSKLMPKPKPLFNL
ncbi:conserved Plasmodium protein, unknown function [Plasmodium gallinaceum]|uniref:Uncharacterized protein n=1 Tax=Plasmodium gallinaceum TaxID=5849 RepID=A0A1J1GQ13_PLAGA|nr:conserved Plasmodium protein, unknown function [Plasmodium gallinaceum]CRG93114.1 conserved Plasmodium protein, unknown function [Plasmodium gallinaceum]